jgi:uncharacterized membrane protein
VGGLTRYYIGRKLVQTIDNVLLSLPLLNKIYSTIKQVNNAFSSEKQSSFQQVVLVEFPRPGMHSVGFVTGTGNPEFDQRTGQSVVSVFVPTTPNPTTGFLVLVPQSQLLPLNVSVADGIKFIISLGSAPPEQAAQPELPLAMPVVMPPDSETTGVTEFVTAAVQRAAAGPEETAGRRDTPSAPNADGARPLHP